MKVVIIAAISRNNVIGRQGALPWRYPADLRRFRQTTSGYPVIFGRKTFCSLPRRPLPGRLNLVVSRNPALPVAPGVVVCSSLEEALTHCRQLGACQAFVAGGAQLYRLALPLADELQVTLIPEEVEGDAFFPPWDPGAWELVDSHAVDDLRFITYRRRPAPAFPSACTFPSNPFSREVRSMFEQLTMAPPDPILGLTVAFKEDPNPAKINLGAGVYKDDRGNTPIFASVKQAEERLLARQTSKSYLPIDGPPEYARAVQELLLGADHPILAESRAVTVQTPGGTGGLRLAGDFIHQHFPQARVWLSEPTWANHPKIFQAAGLQVEEYPYFDAAANTLQFDRMLAGIQQIPAGDVLLLHGCCHNPTGVDPSAAQWTQLAESLAGRGIVLLIDFAYQGLGEGLRADAAGPLALCRPGIELLIASSFSKNFGLYSERVGALTLIAGDAGAAARGLSQLKVAIRTSYSNPPAHGSAIVAEILNDPQLREQWEGEVAQMRTRINQMRQLFVDTLKAKGIDRDFSFISRQRGMFSFSGLTPEQVKQLRDQYSIYLVGSGRLNVAGMTPQNMDALCTAIAAVL